jgi:FXSXX-COOH protein
MQYGAQPILSGQDRCQVTDLRRVPLGQLARRSADAEDTVAAVVHRILEGMDGPSHVPALKFNSAI